MKKAGANDKASFWEDFTHSAVNVNADTVALYSDFRKFRRIFEGLPMPELIERGWIDPTEEGGSVAELFFALRSGETTALFRKSESKDESVLAMWLSLVKLNAKMRSLRESIPQFASLSKQDLKEIAKMSIDVGIIRELPARLSKKGIVLVYFRALSGMRLDGAAFRLSSGQMVIGMSFRFSRLDYFWFTLMHELSHLVLHKEILEHPILVDVEENGIEVNEKAANKLAKESFVNRSSWRNCEPKYDSGSAAVIRYAEKEGIHPSIVAGLLRREEGRFTRYNDLVNQHNVRDIIFKE